MATQLQSQYVYRMRVYCLAVGQLAVNQYDYLVNELVSGTPTIEQMAIYLESLVAPLYKSFMNVDASYRGITLVQQQPKAFAAPVQEITGRGPGTVGVTGNLVPTSTTLNCRKITQTYGRGRQGMVKLPFLDKTMQSDNVVSTIGAPLATAIIQGLATGLFTTTSGGNVATFLPCVWSKVAIPPLGFHYSLITQAYYNSTLGTLHKRGGTSRLNVSPVG